jgi:hypothetical protein
MRMLEEKPEIVADEGGVDEFKHASDGLGDGKQSSLCFRDNVGGVQHKSRKDTTKGPIELGRSTSQMVAPRCSRVGTVRCARRSTDVAIEHQDRR